MKFSEFSPFVLKFIYFIYIFILNKYKPAINQTRTQPSTSLMILSTTIKVKRKKSKSSFRQLIKKKYIQDLFMNFVDDSQ